MGWRYAVHLKLRGHIRFCGDGDLGFRPYGGSLCKAQSNQTLSPLTYGASPRLAMPSLRSCSVGPPPSAIHGRGRLTRHPCRVAHYAEPPLGLSRGRVPQKHCEAAYRPAYLFKRTHSPVGASLLAKDVNDNACCLNERGVRTSFASRLAPTGTSLLWLLILLLILICPVGRPSAGSAQWAPRQGCRGSRPRPWMADGGGPTEQDRSEGMASLGEPPNERGKSALVTFALFESDPP